MATLINGDGNLAIAAAQDADWFASIMGNQTSITGVGHQFAAEVISATEIALSDGVIITKEGRRIQLDTDQVDTFDIPAGGADITNYYIIGYYLYRDADSNELCEPFVELMDSSTATIEEETFKGGADEVFVSLYRVTFTEFAISNVQALLPSINSIRQLSTSINQINVSLIAKRAEVSSTQATISAKIQQLYNACSSASELQIGRAFIIRYGSNYNYVYRIESKQNNVYQFCSQQQNSDKNIILRTLNIKAADSTAWLFSVSGASANTLTDQTTANDTSTWELYY